jgi:hypothetical protein
MLVYVHFLLYFEGTDLATLAHLVATFARCGKYSCPLAHLENTAPPSKAVSLSTRMQASSQRVDKETASID